MKLARRPGRYIGGTSVFRLRVGDVFLWRNRGHMCVFMVTVVRRSYIGARRLGRA